MILSYVDLFLDSNGSKSQGVYINCYSGWLASVNCFSDVRFLLLTDLHPAVVDPTVALSIL